MLPVPTTLVMLAVRVRAFRPDLLRSVCACSDRLPFSYVDDGKPSPSDTDAMASKDFWLELARLRLKGSGGAVAPEPADTDADDGYTIDGQPKRQPGEPFSEMEAKLLVLAARERLEASGMFREIDSRTQRTVSRILKAFREARVVFL